MSLEQTWTDQTAVANSSALTPTDHIGVCFSGTFTGEVWVEFLNPFTGETVWNRVEESHRRGPAYFTISVPDTAVTFRFGCANIDGTVNCYMGP